MELFQVLVGSMFSLLAASAILYIAYRAHGIGNDVAEMKEFLRDIRRAAQDQQISSAPQAASTPIPKALASPEAGNWPSVLDPEYNAVDYDSDSRPAESRR
jgi:hypothetical protein